MKKLLLISLALGVLAGCTGSDLQRGVLMSSGQLDLRQAAPGQPYDYIVDVGNVGDIGYNPDQKEQRDKVALNLVSVQCPNASIVGETELITGRIPIRNKVAKTYQIQVRCNA